MTIFLSKTMPEELLTFTCQQCGHQHDAPDTSCVGTLQKSREKWCYPCKRNTFHFAAKPSSSGLNQDSERGKPRRKGML